MIKSLTNYIKETMNYINNLVQDILDDEIFNSPQVKFPKIIN
jgi:hypothetical protein